MFDNGLGMDLQVGYDRVSKFYGSMVRYVFRLLHF